MPNKSTRLKRLTDSARSRVTDLVQHPEDIERLVKTYGPIALNAVACGINRARAKRGAASKHPALNRGVWAAALALSAIHVAIKPVSGSIKLARGLAGAGVGQFIHDRVSGKASRFVATATTVALLDLAERRAQAWAAANEQLQVIEARGLGADTTADPAEFVTTGGWGRARQSDPNED